MGDHWTALAERAKLLGANWTVALGVASFAVYAFGYLSLRFKLTVLGVSTDLTFIDERYLFEGLRFLVYLASIVPNLLFGTLLIGGLGGVLYAAGARLAGTRVHCNIVSRVAGWWQPPRRRLLLGIVLALLLSSSNLLPVHPAPRETAWLWLYCRLVTDTVFFYFHGLVAAVVPSALLLGTAGGTAPEHWSTQRLRAILTLLLTFEILLLPVNYGVLVSPNQAVPVVTLQGEARSLVGSEPVWLVWEGKQGFTVFTKDRSCCPGQPALVTVPASKVAGVEVLRQERLLGQLFGASPACAADRSPPLEGR